jgi:hypothetical protein
MHPIESLLVDGTPVKPNLFAVPEMSLSSARANTRALRFRLKASATDLIQLLEPAYAKWVAESKLDDELCGGPQDELAAAGYPELSCVLDSPSLSALLLGHYLLQDFLGKCTWDGHSKIVYWLDVVESCHVEQGSVHILGRCYSRADLGGARESL